MISDQNIKILSSAISRWWLSWWGFRVVLSSSNAVYVSWKAEIQLFTAKRAVGLHEPAMRIEVTT